MTRAPWTTRQAPPLRGTPSGIPDKFLVGFEDFLGVVSLMLCLVATATTWTAPPEAGAAFPSWAGYLGAALYGFASALFFLAAHHLYRTGLFSPLRHVAPVLCTLMVPVLSAVIAVL